VLSLMPVMTPPFFKCLGAVLSLYSILSEWLLPYPVAHLLVQFSLSSLVSPCMPCRKPNMAINLPSSNPDAFMCPAAPSSALYQSR